MTDQEASTDAQLYLVGLQPAFAQEWRRRSRSVRYQYDPVAWLWDVLGKRWWSGQEEIAWSFVENMFTLVKSCNGAGKTQIAGDLLTWFVSVFPVTETIGLCSAPVRNQIDENLFGYMRENYHIAAQRKQPLLGEITRWPKWTVKQPYDYDMVIPKRPADQNLLSSFQGIHRRHVAVVLDEAGGLQEDFYIAANAVTTNEHARILGIGNPDMRNTAFHRRFQSASVPDAPLTNEPTALEIESKQVYRGEDGRWWRYGDTYRDWHRYTIKTRDLPTHTGEVIYPENPERDAEVKSKMTQPEWTAMMERTASPGVVAAKVNGEFPDEDETTFFSQTVINRAWETFTRLTELKDSGAWPTFPNRKLGVDVAFTGADKNVITLNEEGLVTILDRWGKEEGEDAVEELAIARRVHRWAQDLGVSEVRIDAAGTSRGVHSTLKTHAEFTDRAYTLIGIVGNRASADPKQWVNARAWHYDQVRKLFSTGAAGISMAESELRTDLEVQTYSFTPAHQLKITSKEDLKKDLKRSPDTLDAVVYALIDLSNLVGSPIGDARPGDMVVLDPWDLEFAEAGRAGLPIG